MFAAGMGDDDPDKDQHHDVDYISFMLNRDLMMWVAERGKKRVIEVLSCPFSGCTELIGVFSAHPAVVCSGYLFGFLVCCHIR